ncbi:MAG: hypothetical protein FD156_1717 [Nitrospirae bacterium]|nr:MAG: hypothetical protein FD156_1717 [Nitrospirota bacterium]
MQKIEKDKDVFSYRQITQFARDAAAGLMELRHFGFGEEVKNLIINGIELCRFLLTGYELTQKEVNISFDNMPTWKAFQKTASKKPLVNGESLKTLVDKANEVRKKLDDIIKSPQNYVDKKDEIINCEKFFIHLLHGLTETTTFK